MKNSPSKYEVVRILGVDYLRVPYVQRGWCTGCACDVGITGGNKTVCDLIETEHKMGCVGAILIHNTPEAIERYEVQMVIERLEGES